MCLLQFFSVILLQALAFFIIPFMKSLKHYYGVQSLSLMQYGAWASARTLITFCVNSNEVGKIYASVGIIAAIIPLISNPVFRQIYNTVSIWRMTKGVSIFEKMYFDKINEIGIWEFLALQKHARKKLCVEFFATKM